MITWGDCQVCHATMRTRDGEEPTPLCDHCAHDAVAAALRYRKLENSWANLYGWAGGGHMTAPALKAKFDAACKALPEARAALDRALGVAQ